MINEMRDFVLELVQSEYETGHILAEDRNEFNELCRDEGYRATKAMYDLYEECHNLGPAGFYEEYRDELDFDPSFVAEYGDEDVSSSDASIDSANGFNIFDKVHVKTFDFNGQIIDIKKAPSGRIIVEVRRDAADGFFDPYLFNPDELELINEEFEDSYLEEALSNKEKLKRAYPELNFDNPVTETLTEAVDSEDKMQTAVGILYDMDNFVLSVYDNGYWLSMGVPDGEFSEDDRDLAEANYKEHEWLIEGDEEGSFDREAFKDLLDAFDTATDDSDYDQNERARIIHEAETILNMNESVDDMNRRCENCNTLLNEAGKCPKCDEGEEDLNEDILNEAPDKLTKKLNKLSSNDDKLMIKRAQAAPTIIRKSLDPSYRYIIDGEMIDSKVYQAKVDKVKNEILNSDKLLGLDPDSTLYKEVKDVLDVVAIDKKGWIVRRGLELLKPGKMAYRADRADLLEIPDAASSQTFLSKQFTNKTNEIKTDSENQVDPDQSENDDTKPEVTSSDDANIGSNEESNQEAKKPDWITNDSIKAAITLLAKRKNGSADYYDKDGNLIDYRKITTDNIDEVFINKEATEPFIVAMEEVKKGLAKRKAAAIKSAALFGESYDDSMEYENIEEIELSESLNKEDMSELLNLSKQLGIETIGDLDQFSKREIKDGEDLLTAMKRYKGEVDGDIEPLEEVFSENVITEEFTTYSDIRSQFEMDKINYSQREAFESMLVKACRSLNIDPELALIYVDKDREFDPVYFADESKELQYNVLKVKVFDLDIVRIEFKGTIYIIFRSQADADIYMNYAH